MAEAIASLARRNEVLSLYWFPAHMVTQMIRNPARRVNQLRESKSGDDVLTEGYQRGKVIRKIIRIHQIGEDDCEEIDPDQNIGNPTEPVIRFLEEEAQVTISAHEEIRCHQNSHRIVDSTDLRGSKIMVY